MRKKSVLAILILIIPAFLFAERIWVYTDPSKNKTEFDLEKALYLPKLSTAYNQKGGYGNELDGTYSAENVIGNFGCIDCGCEIEFTVSTSGRLVSQSDTTKYKNFQIALIPRITANKTDQTYLWNVSTGEAIDSAEYAPHTIMGQQGELVIKAPGFSASNRSVPTPEGNVNCTRWWCDMLMIMDEPTMDDIRHMYEGNDYVARVNISWKCTDVSHTDHKGSFTLVLRGYFRVNEGNKDAKVIVTPDPKAMDLNIINVMKNPGNMEHIANILVVTNTSTAAWSNRLFVFVSSSSDAFTQGDEFKLKRVNDSQTIPFSVVVEHGNANGTAMEYDGTAKYSAETRGTVCLNLTTQHSINRDGSDVYIVDYSDDIFIKIPPIAALTTPANEEAYNAALVQYGGIYTSTIYYHVIYDDNVYETPDNNE